MRYGVLAGVVRQPVPPPGQWDKVSVALRNDALQVIDKQDTYGLHFGTGPAHTSVTWGEVTRAFGALLLGEYEEGPARALTGGPDGNVFCR